jgi:hypothetical protein
MMKRGLNILVLICFSCGAVAQQADFNVLVTRYIQEFKGIAVKEMMVYRVPASITLAQGIIESSAGTSKLAMEANNHFGIKCHKGWNGDTFYQDDDEKQECFRKYSDPVESFRDHSYFLTLRDRYKSLFELDVTDYQGWAKGLKAAGYATDPTYADKLIKMIQTYSLNTYDNADFSSAFGDSFLAIEDVKAREAWLSSFIVVGEGTNGRHIYENNRLQLTIARKGDNLDKIGRDFDITPKKLAAYNDMGPNPTIKPGQMIYLESKRRKAAASSHVVKEKETLFMISQMYGIKLKMLYKRNDIPEGLEPPKGRLLQLR